jgi:hypothetical protein
MTLGCLRHGIALQGQPDGDVVFLEGTDHLAPSVNVCKRFVGGGLAVLRLRYSGMALCLHS